MRGRYQKSLDWGINGYPVKGFLFTFMVSYIRIRKLYLSEFDESNRIVSSKPITIQYGD
jgi:hypothetical protein